MREAASSSSSGVPPGGEFFGIRQQLAEGARTRQARIRPSMWRVMLFKPWPPCRNAQLRLNVGNHCFQHLFARRVVAAP
jgi:hypothetical protein